MNALQTWIQSPLAAALGKTLFHFLWEGAALAGLLAAALFACRRASAPFRYALATLALWSMLAAFGVTLAVLFPHAAGRLPARFPAPVLAFPSAPAMPPLPPAPSQDRLAWAAPFWLAGVLALSLYRLGSWMAARRLRRAGICAAPPEWVARVADLARQLGVSRPVLLLESCLAEVPMVIGYVRPAILTPLGMLAGMAPAQVEAILLHELAHIRRADYLFNLVQSAIEGLLFYHPAVWWVSGLVRAEREHCCDDVAVAGNGDAHAYALALATLEQNRWGAPAAGLAATGGNLANRIRRLLAPPEGPRLAGLPLLFTGILTAALVLVPVWHARLARAQSPAAGPPKLLAQAQAATTDPLPASHAGPARAQSPAAGPTKLLAQAQVPPPQPAPDSPYTRWLNEDVAYIITPQERAAFLSLTSNADRELFIAQFWQRRDPTPGTSRNEFMEEHYRRIQYANNHFADSRPGWRTDRGRIYIMFGPPDERDEHPSGGTYERPPAEGGGITTTFPFEDWRYRFIEGIGNDVVMEFVDQTGSGEYRMTRDPSEKVVGAVGPTSEPPAVVIRRGPALPVLVAGQANRPGIYPVGSLKELIEKAGLTPSADPKNARITHILPNGEYEREAVDLQAILDGTASDVQLRSGDVVTIPTR